MKNLLLALSIVLVGVSAFAQSSSSCYSRAADINRGLDQDARLAQNLDFSSQNIQRNAYNISQSVYRLKQPGKQVDLNRELGQPLEQTKEKVLRARQAMYNIRVLLNELKHNPEMNSEMLGIINNIIDNNLTPAENSNDTAMTNIDGIKNQVSKLNEDIKPNPENIRILDTIDREAQQAQRDTNENSRTAQRIASDMGYAKRSVETAVKMIRRLK